MIIRRISVMNFMCFLGEHTIRLGEGVTVVVAEYAGAEKRSNRGGKSTIASDAPRMALYGSLRTGSVDEACHRAVAGREDWWTEVEVETSGGAVRTIRQGRTAKGKPIRMLDGVDVKEEDLSAAVVGKIVGLTEEEYQLTNAFVQGDIHAFMSLSPAEKRKVVSPWFKTDRWAPRADLAKRRLSEAKAYLRALDEEENGLVQADPDAVEAQMREAALAHEQALSDLDVARIGLSEAKAQVGDRSSIEAELAEARREEAKAKRMRDEEVQSASSEASNAAAALARAEAAVKRAQEREAKLAPLLDAESQVIELGEAQNKASLSVSKLDLSLKNLESTRASKLEVYKRLTEQRTGICPILKEACGRVARDESEIEKLVSDGKQVAVEISIVKQSLDSAKQAAEQARQAVAKARQAAQEASALRQGATVEQAEAARVAAAGEVERASLKKLAVERGGTAADKLLNQNADRVKSLGSRIANMDFSAVMEAEARVAGLKVLSDAVGRNVAKFRADLEIHRQAAERRRQISAAREAHWQLVTDLTWASYAFGAVGIPSREMENAFHAAEDSMNAVLAGLGSQMRVRFAPTRELKEWEPSCLACGEKFASGERTHVCRACGVARQRRRRDELRMEVLEGERVSSFGADSGGGKVLLSLGVRFGLARLPGMVRAASCQHALIDEPDGMLDEPNRDALHKLLRTRLKTVGIRQAILVTHAPVREEFDQVVEIVRHEAEDRSEVRNA